MSLQNAVPQAVFGPGSLYVTRIDLDDQTPYNIGYAQEFSYDESGETKELYGQKQYPLVIARGTLKASGKIKAATLSGLALNAVFGGGTFTDGQIKMAQAEAHDVPAAATATMDAANMSTAVYPVAATTNAVVGAVFTGHANIPDGSYVVSVSAGVSFTANVAATGTVPDMTVLTFAPNVTVDHAADFNLDLGVLNGATTIPLLLSTGVVGAGMYAVHDGVYSFNSAEVAAEALITYAYDDASGGQTVLVVNQNIGTTPAFQLDYVSELYGDSYYVRMFAAVSNKLTRAHKLTDFVMPEIDFGFFALGNGNVYEISYAKKS
jgi:hypothetical protein